jgi:hypothetical protein
MQFFSENDMKDLSLTARFLHGAVVFVTILGIHFGLALDGGGAARLTPNKPTAQTMNRASE